MPTTHLASSFHRLRARTHTNKKLPTHFPALAAGWHFAGWSASAHRLRG